jgi:diacylglycerol O-acyltransferase / wax synthase
VADDLSAADRASLQAERGSVSMAVAGLLVFEEGPGFAHEALEERLLSRLHILPRYRQRLQDPPVGLLGNPVWVDDDSFDVHWHLRRTTLPAPGDRTQLEALMAREMSRRLDRSRPLWEMTVVEGIEGGRTGLLARMHHALVDGVAALDVGTVMLDPTPEPMEIPAPDQPWEPRSYDRRGHLMRLAAGPVSKGRRLFLESAVRALDTSPRRAAEDMRRAADLMAELARARPQAPMTPLNEPLSPNRSYATARADLAEIKRVGKSLDATVNDVLLAAVTGMVERYLEQAGTALERPPVALVPVSVRKEEARGELGNHISTVFVDLPVAEHDPPERVRQVSATVKEIRESAAVRAGALMVGATGWAPPLVSSVMVRAMGGVRAFNLVVSNVPGPQQTFYLAGSKLLEAYPAVPLNPGNQRLTVGILSYDGSVFFGLLGDRDLDPPIAVARGALEAALGELLGG